GQWVGNPAISEIVSTYIVSLHWRKVQQGETPQSSRAIRPVCLLLQLRPVLAFNVLA
ncbi:hypothetical protein ARMGADRAFT_936287, partial [Armillaria gallica]